MTLVQNHVLDAAFRGHSRAYKEIHNSMVIQLYQSKGILTVV